MKYAISLDVGVTTGLAVYWIAGEEFGLKETHAIGKDDLRASIKYLIREYLFSYSVAELPLIVRGPLGNQLQDVVSVVRAELPHQCEWITPSQWKSTPSAKLPCPRGLTTHERDAIRIGDWFLRRRLAT